MFVKFKELILFSKTFVYKAFKGERYGHYNEIT